MINNFIWTSDWKLTWLYCWGAICEIEKKPIRIKFYGIRPIQEAFYLLPSNHYQTYPIIPRSLVNATHPTLTLLLKDIKLRYAILSFMQTNKERWLDLLLPDKKSKVNFH